MNTGKDQVRDEVNSKCEPPVDVLLDPSLLIRDHSLRELPDSSVLESQMQATLSRNPTKPRLGDLYVPSTIHQILSNQNQSSVQKTDVWDFYRGQAEAAFPEDVLDLLNKNDVEKYSEKRKTSPQLVQRTNAIEDLDRRDQLVQALSEEFSFLQSGGIVLSNTSRTFEVFRDAGVPTIEIGKADLAPELRETLTDIGYRNPANVCAFGVSAAESATDALVGDVLTNPPNFLLYRLGD